MKTLFLILFLSSCTLYCFSQKLTGQTSNEEGKVVTFYPNPANEVITFDINHVVEKGYTIQIYNFLARMVKTVSISSIHVTVPISELYRGIYIFQLRDKNGVIIESNKFQVIK